MITTKQIGTAVMIFMALVAAASQGGLHLPLGVPETWGPYIQSWSASIMALYLIINPFLPASVFGPLSPSPQLQTLTKDTKVTAPAGTQVQTPNPTKDKAMPSTSKKQAKTMAAAAHNPAFAKKVGIPTKVAKDFNKADMRKKRK